MQDFQGILERRKKLLGPGLRIYYEVPFQPVRAQGVFMYEADGTRYLDAYNNVPHVGHCHPRVVEAIAKQAAALNTNTRYLHESVLDYAQRLVDTMPEGLDTVLFTCTGSESNDLAGRLARTFTGNDGFITTHGGYHGNTTFLNAIDGPANRMSDKAVSWWARVGHPDESASVTEAEHNRKAEQYEREVAGAVERLQLQGGHRPAAFFFDSYFCTDGIHAPPPGIMAKAVASLHRAGGLIIADEVQPGLGRNGEYFWGFQSLGIVPDIVTSGKPLGNGHPIGMVVTRREIVEAFFASERYFNTFGGNPVSMAAGLAVLDVIRDEGLQSNALVVGERLISELRRLAGKYEILGAVHGKGLLIGVEVVKDSATGTADADACTRIINELCLRGVLVGNTGPTRTARNILKIRPPLVFDNTHLDELITKLDDVLTAIQ